MSIIQVLYQVSYTHIGFTIVKLKKGEEKKMSCHYFMKNIWPHKSKKFY